MDVFKKQLEKGLLQVVTLMLTLLQLACLKDPDFIGPDNKKQSWLRWQQSAFKY